jgi:2-polyprenyl-3-methyl-5-hydroxy-6-metoxy-1,4-benzoquinol methylase
MMASEPRPEAAQVTSGIRAILSKPIVYDTLQRLMGADRGRVQNVRNYVRPFPGMRILDLGCGTAGILEALPMDVVYVGYDMSPDYIAAARRRYGSRGTFHCRLLEQAEVAAFEPFDLVMGLGVLHHLDDGTARQFMSLGRAAIKADGRIYTMDPCFSSDQSAIARFLISRDRGQHVRTADGYRSLASGIFASVTGSLIHRSWVPYTRWHMECSISPSSGDPDAAAASGARSGES